MPDPSLAPGQIPVRERRTLAEEWALFAKGIPVGSKPEQVRTVQTAFYGGAASLFLLLSELDASADPTEADLEYTEGLAQEVRDFWHTTYPPKPE